MYYRISKNEKNLFFGKKIAQVWAVTLSDEKELACLWSANETIKKQTEEFNGILHASFRTKMPTSDKVMPHDQMHWLKTLIFTHLLFIYLISLQFSMDGRMDNWADPGMDPGFFVRRRRGGGGGGGGVVPSLTSRTQDLHMGPKHMYVHMHTYMRMYKQAHEC